MIMVNSKCHLLSLFSPQYTCTLKATVISLLTLRLATKFIIWWIFGQAADSLLVIINTSETDFSFRS